MSKDKGKKKKEKKKVQGEGKELRSTVLDVMPVIALDEKTGAGRLAGGGLFDLLRLVSKDLNAISDEEYALDNLSRDKLYRTYAGDLKIIAMSYPADTSSQQAFFAQKLASEPNPVFKDMLIEEYERASYIASTRTEREFYLGFFAKDAAEYKEHVSTIFAVMRGLVEVIPKAKKEEIYTRLYNKCAAL